MLKKDQCLRFLGHGEIFETYPYSKDTSNFHTLDMSRETLKAGWINPTDIEKSEIEE